MKKVTLGLFALIAVTAGAAMAANTTDIGGVATQVIGSLGPIAKLVTAGSYVAGMAFAVGAIIKFKAHKDNPTQVPISTGVVLLFVAAALLFAPTVFRVSGQTMFGASGTVAGPSGVTTFGAVQEKQ